MGVPKNFRKDLHIGPKTEGVERRQELRDNIAKNGTFLPKGVHYEDIDRDFIKFVNKDLMIVIDGEQVPVIFLTIQRWSEFSKTWEHSDEYKNIKIPFITIVRQPDVQVGTTHNGYWNVPGRPSYTYMKVPTFDGAREGVDLYKIPQPTAVDITYEVRIFCSRMKDLNVMNEKVVQAFKSRQFYIFPNRHPMPVVLESIADESPIDDFENRRFYIQPFEMKVQGYILDEKDFEVTPTINRMLLMQEITETKGPKPRISVFTDNETGAVNLNVIFRTNSSNIVCFPVEQDTLFETVDIITNINTLVFKVNGVVKTLPFRINLGEELDLEITRGVNATAQFLLKGTAL
jgi:hypothetical protein